MTIGEAIKTARKAVPMTQKELAEKLGVSAVNISQLENGARTPKIETLQNIAKALGVSTLDLLGPYEGPELPGLGDGDKLAEMEPFDATPKGRVNKAMDRMNDKGQEKTVEYAEDLAGNPDYQK